MWLKGFFILKIRKLRYRKRETQRCSALLLPILSALVYLWFGLEHQENYGHWLAPPGKKKESKLDIVGTGAGSFLNTVYIFVIVGYLITSRLKRVFFKIFWLGFIFVC